MASNLSVTITKNSFLFNKIVKIEKNIKQLVIIKGHNRM